MKNIRVIFSINSLGVYLYQTWCVQSFGDSALLFEVVYHVTDSDYNLYMDIQQRINLDIKESFEKENISMAYPTQTVYVAK